MTALPLIRRATIAGMSLAAFAAAADVGSRPSQALSAPAAEAAAAVAPRIRETLGRDVQPNTGTPRMISSQAFRLRTTAGTLLVPLTYASVEASNQICALAALNGADSVPSVVRIAGENRDASAGEVSARCENVFAVAFLRARDRSIIGVYLAALRAGQPDIVEAHVMRIDPASGAVRRDEALTSELRSIPDLRTLGPAVARLRKLNP